MEKPRKGRTVLFLELSEEQRNAVHSLIADAVAAEREACARLVETWGQDNETIQPSNTRMVAAIRARGEEF